MGEVYKARDTRLDRTVAIKVLPGHLASSPEVRQRFEREAKTISQLSHPHICALFDVGETAVPAEGAGREALGAGREEIGTGPSDAQRRAPNAQRLVQYLVMEYLEGETLGERLARGALPLDQVLRYGAQIADALDKAHRRGIVHRDLKPGNVMLTASGVKLLDFGLAKSLEPPGSPSDFTSNPTAAAPPDLTQEGTILGTLSYMAPEQLEGREADRRTDVFALGATLYEMASGRKAFSGAGRASLISSILRDDPTPVSKIQPMTPRSLDRVVGRCLAKDPERRWQSAADVGLELADIAAGEPRADERREIRPRRIGWIGAAALALLVGALAWMAGRSLARPPAAAARVSRVAILPPRNSALALGEPPAVSSDGRQIAFVAIDASGTYLLYVRPLGSSNASPLPGTEGARMPFWSPDGRSIGFFAQGKLKTIELAGGRVQTLAEASTPRGGTWSSQGSILFVPSPRIQPHLISASGGEAKAVPVSESVPGVFTRRSPYFLPDGRHYLYLAYDRSEGKHMISVGAIDSKESKRLVSSRSTAAYAAPGYLLYRRDRELVAQRFDAARLELIGSPVPIAPEVGYNPITMHSLFAASGGDSLVYFPPDALQTQLAWFDRNGKEVERVGSAGYRNSVSLSADGRRVAFDETSEAGDLDVWSLDVGRSGAPSRVTFGIVTDMFPVLSPDGTRVVFSSLRGGPPTLYEKPTSGATAEVPLTHLDRPQMGSTWSIDGRYLSYTIMGPNAKWDIWVLPMTGERASFAFADTPFDERSPEISPDGNWMAYSSDETGTPEVYVRPFPKGAGKWQLTRGGGFQPHWRRDGKELYYVTSDGRIVALEVRGRPPVFEAGAATSLFRARMASGLDSSSAWNTYAVSADGQRFLINRLAEAAERAPLMLVLDWEAEIGKR
jgi:Tol biopolymer transport system component